MSDQQAMSENGSEQFEKALALYEKGELKASLEVLVSLAADERWFDRCARYIVAITRSLKSLEQPDSPEWKRLSKIESEVRSSRSEGDDNSLAAIADKQDSNAGVADEGDEDINAEVANPPYSELRDRVLRRSFDPLSMRRGFNNVLGSIFDTTAPRKPVLVERTPHIDIFQDGPLKEGDTCRVRVYLDGNASHVGEFGTSILAPSGIRVEMILMTSSHFAISGQDRTSFVFEGTNATIELPPFKLTVQPRAEWKESTAGVIATFFIDGRPCGNVSRQIALLDIPEQSRKISSASVVIVPNGAPPVDLRITVYSDPINNDRQFWCTVSTPHLWAYTDGKQGVWNLKETTSETVHGFMERFTADNTSPDQLIAELRGAGKLLFDASPQIFKDVFWALIDAKAPLKTIAIVTAEPYFPWELMIPRRFVAGVPEERDNPLGVDFNVGRWTDPEVVAPLWKINLSDSFIIAPDYGGNGDLEAAAAEAAMVRSLYNGIVITPASFTQIKTTLLGEARSLIHFICHGESGGVGSQTLRLEGNDSLTSSALIGIKGLGKIIRSRRPVIFLNACEVGRATPSLVGLGGFASAFIELGASAVIAPLWSVDDKIAHKIAEEFYRSVRANPTMPFSQIFATIRAKAYDGAIGRDTYAAYCFFGDPLASGV